MAKVYATPGVYIEEKSAFPNSAVPVPTAVPAFIGYTEKAIRDNKDLKNVPTKISSFDEYQMFFGEGPKTTFQVEKNMTDPSKVYQLKAMAQTRFFLYYSMKLFFANGGSDCYIVSIGDYSNAKRLEDFIDKGITPLLKFPEPTMLVIPDAMLLESAADCFSLQQEMLKHCGLDMRNRVAIFDIYNGFKPQSDPETGKDVIKEFRTGIGNNFLDFGAAYYPWLETSITSASEIDLAMVSSDSLKSFQGFLQEEVESAIKDGLVSTERGDQVKAEIAKVTDTSKHGDDLHKTLLAKSPVYKAIMTDIRKELNILPPSGAMAGIYSFVDNTVGVFQSPANVSVGSVVKPTVNITNEEQEGLNLPLDGKAINAIRSFPGKGTLVWGARTLDGNSQDWRYISVRRTVIFIEQSIKYAIEPYVFEPNVAATWSNLKALITNFLTNTWQSGALAGATSEDAFSVDLGLGTTMTPVDILEGYMRVTVKIAVTRPAEFIVLSFEQKMQSS